MVRIEGIAVVMRRLVKVENRKISEARRRQTPLNLRRPERRSSRTLSDDAEPKIALSRATEANTNGV